MERVDIFATQRSSVWFQRMLAEAQNDLGHTDLSWITRAMLALKPAGLPGRFITMNELDWAITPFVGKSANNVALNNMTRAAVQRGIMRPTGRKKRVEGVRNAHPEYEVVGHCEIDHATGDLLHYRMRNDECGGETAGILPMPVRYPCRKTRRRRSCGAR